MAPPLADASFEPLSRRLAESVAAVRTAAGLNAASIQVGVILGSGLGDFADALPDAVRLPYGEIPHMPRPSVAGHEGALALARVNGLALACLQGRAHYYEGHSPAEATYPVRLLRALGAETLIVTNAAGGVSPRFGPGDLMIIADHVNLMGMNPLRGANEDAIGLRFPDMTAAYDPSLRRMAREVGRLQGLELHEGVYAAVSGPSYETPAEIRLLAALGVDAVGMSTVPEVIVARHGGMRALGISCIANAAAGLSDAPLSHQEVLQAGARAKPAFSSLLSEILRRLSTEGAPSPPS